MGGNLLDCQGNLPYNRSMNTTDIAYLAGILDGEGSIGIKPPPPSSPSHQLSVQIANTNRELLSWIQSFWGGCINKEVRRSPHHKQVWKLQIGGKKAGLMLRAIRPYIRIKAYQSEIAFAFLSLGRLPRKDQNEKIRILHERDRLYYAMKSLNKRGQG